MDAICGIFQNEGQARNAMTSMIAAGLHQRQMSVAAIGTAPELPPVLPVEGQAAPVQTQPQMQAPQVEPLDRPAPQTGPSMKGGIDAILDAADEPFRDDPQETIGEDQSFTSAVSSAMPDGPAPADPVKGFVQADHTPEPLTAFAMPGVEPPSTTTADFEAVQPASPQDPAKEALQSAPMQAAPVQPSAEPVVTSTIDPFAALLDEATTIPFGGVEGGHVRVSGPLAVPLAGATSGNLNEAMAAVGIPDGTAQAYTAALRQGKILLMVQPENETQIMPARAVLMDGGALTAAA